jgi:hypothetical protein
MSTYIKFDVLEFEDIQRTQVVYNATVPYAMVSPRVRLGTVSFSSVHREFMCDENNG